ncbi:MAG: hypothetical protein AAGI48_12930 [Verrucomicrobiota bacterium]
MKITRLIGLAVAPALLSGVASAATVLIDSSTNNGSFDDELFDTGPGTNVSGGSLSGAAPSQRYSSSASNNTMTIPGWSVVSQSPAAFHGVNFDGSTPAKDGQQSIVVNDGNVVQVISTTFVGTYAAGDEFDFAASIGLNGGDQVAYNFRIQFNDGGGASDLVSTVFQEATDEGTGYIDYSGTFTYAGPGATEVFVVATINTAVAGDGNQGMFDAVSLSYEPVPEPSIALLGSLGLLGLLRRRR